jgi:ABC-type nitrate/sulfonate/bicarbonate transport system substrate-binding protein
MIARLVVAVVVALTALTAGPGPVAAQKTARVTVGMQPLWQEQGAQAEYYRQSRVYEKWAKKFGYDLTVDYKDFLSGLPVNEALISGTIQIGLLGSAPMVQLMSRGIPIHPIAGAESRLEFAVAVPPGSPIKDLQDLVERKATIGTLIGSEIHRFVLEMFQAEFGKTPEALGVRLVQMTQPDMLSMPKGVDAVTPASPGVYKMQNVTRNGVILVSSYGTAGPAHKLGAGAVMPGAKNAWAWPEGYIGQRGFYVVRTELVKEHPDLVVAFLLAHQEASKALHKEYRKIWELGNKYFQMPFEAALPAIKNGMLFTFRDWIWVTEGDVAHAVNGARFMHRAGTLKQPVDWNAVVQTMTPVAPLVKRAYEQAGNYPAEAEFLKKQTPDFRGYPSWMLDRWDVKRWRID